MRRISQAFALLLCLVIWLSVSLPGLAQNIAASNSSAASEKGLATDKEFAGKFWKYLLSNNYKQWSPVPGKTANYFSSGSGASGTLSPHGTVVKTYVNRIAAGNPDSLPVGSILIMENYRQDRSLETISVMYRTANYNPAANDWYWVNYNADGSVTSQRTGGVVSNVRKGVQQASATVPLKRKMVGRSVSCIECHKSGGDDLAFFNHESYTQIAAAPIVVARPQAPKVRAVSAPRTVIAKSKPKRKPKPKRKKRPATRVSQVPKQNVFYPSGQTTVAPCPT